MIKIVENLKTVEPDNEPTLQATLQKYTDAETSKTVSLTFRDENNKDFSPIIFEVQKVYSDGGNGFHLRFWVKNENRTNGPDHTLFTYKLPNIPSFK